MDFMDFSRRLYRWASEGVDIYGHIFLALLEARSRLRVSVLSRLDRVSSVLYISISIFNSEILNRSLHEPHSGKENGGERLDLSVRTLYPQNKSDKESTYMVQMEFCG